jgi:hypothetical protein
MLKKNKPSSIYSFPQELANERNDWPFMTFTVNDQEENTVCLPIPQGLTFGDNMSYGSIDLGIIGDIAAKAIGAEKGKVSTGANALLDKVKDTNAAAVASIAAKRGLAIPGVGAEVIDFANRQVVSPNTNTTFQNSTIRNFSFAFKLVSRKQKEAESIKNILDLFQAKMYPEGNELILKYPPTFTIKFFNGSGKENKFIPAIFESYLTGMSAVYNGSTNIFHNDGSPLESDVQLTFQEIKALTREEIVALSRRESKQIRTADSFI